MKKVLSMAACILALVPVMGNAKDAWYNGIYLGAGVGGTRVEADLIDLGLMPADAQGNPETIENNLYKKTSITGKIFAGYRIFKYLGVEAGYQKLNDVEQAFCFTDDTGGCAEQRGLDDSGLSVISSGAWTVEIPLESWSAFAVGLYPINDTFEVFAKLGVVAWESDLAGYEKIVGGFIPPKPPLIPETNVSIAKKIDGTDAAGGIGLNINHESGITVRAELEYFGISELDTSYTFSMSAIYNF
jgi:opacity protein-like surface antigen